MLLLRFLVPMTALLLAPVAMADDEPAEPEETDEAEEDDAGGGWVTAGGGDLSSAEMELDEMSAWAALERLPPKYSWELGVSASFGDITYWNDHRSYTGPYIGQGFRVGWGRNMSGGDHRLGVQTNWSIEGPVPLYYTMALDPLPSWDMISHNIQVGASLGPSLLLHSMLGEGVFAGIAPSAAVRMGYSQSWTRVGRRVFVVLEPRVRLIGGEPQLVGAIVVGQGRGR